MKLMAYMGQGISHAYSDVPCQDSIGYYVDRGQGQWTVALSDGAGSAQFAREAAQETVRTVLGFFAKTPLGVFLQQEEQVQREQLAQLCRERMWQLAQKLECSRVAHVSATMMFACCDGTRLLVGHIGDGAIFCQNHQGVQMLSAPDNEGEDKQYTHFTVEVDSEDHLHLQAFELDELKGETLLLTSDGAMSMFETRGHGEVEKGVSDLLELVRKGDVHNNETLAQALNEMTQQPADRLDDWSILVLRLQESDQMEELPKQESMQDREQEKLMLRLEEQERMEREEADKKQPKWKTLSEYVSEKEGKTNPCYLTLDQGIALVEFVCRELNAQMLEGRTYYFLTPADIQVSKEEHGELKFQLSVRSDLAWKMWRQYVAPEFLQGNYRVDIEQALCYSVGGIFLFATGPKRISDGKALYGVCRRMREEDTTRRFYSLHQLCGALHAVYREVR